jgi:hypothetical protein
MSAERKRLKLYLETSKEKLKVPAGTSECYKMHIVPDSQSMMNMMAPGLKMPPGFGTFAQHLLPPTNRWLSQEEPHYMVKSEGSTDYVTASLSPSEVAEVMIEELVSIERGAT